ncbi:hypothetical protein [Marinovum sp.]|uniref:hypothetical protein n=1 Tax=Marinovum sp. TaxID=2024839 RepID=UPI003A91B083
MTWHFLMSGSAALVLLAQAAAAAPEARACRFERQIYEGVSRAVLLHADIDSDGARASVLVGNGRRYAGRQTRNSAGASAVSFATDVSREIMTIAPGGETLWQINFNDGKTMAYAGHCGPIRKR